MYRRFNYLVFGGLFALTAVMGQDVSQRSSAKELAAFIPAAPVNLPIGLWKVQFSNDVCEDCEVRRDGTASVTEPARSSIGKVVIRGRSHVILFEDDRVERWTVVGKRLVVEHWASSSQWPTSAPVLGIADRVE
jgi:hypothetical protein